MWEVHAPPPPIFSPFWTIQLYIGLLLTAKVSSIDGNKRRLQRSSGGNFRATATKVDSCVMAARRRIGGRDGDKHGIIGAVAHWRRIRIFLVANRWRWP